MPKTFVPVFSDAFLVSSECHALPVQCCATGLIQSIPNDNYGADEFSLMCCIFVVPT